MPIYDYKCECGEVCEKLEFGTEMDAPHWCVKCGKVMYREFSTVSSFRLRYDPKKDKVGWSSDGFATTQRYREINKK